MISIGNGMSGLIKNIFATGIMATIVGSPAYAQAPSPAGSAVGWNNIVAEARKERTVVLYAITPQALLSSLKDDFEKAYPGIVVEFARFAGAGAVVRLDQDRATGADGGDVAITADATWAQERSKQGVLRTPVGPSVKAWPTEYMLTPAVPILALEPVVIAYNSSANVSINGYRDLLKPELKGKIGITDMSGSAVMALYEWLEKTQGRDFLMRLAAQSPKIYSGGAVSTQAVASGEILAVPSASFSVLQALIEKGAPIKVVIPNPGLGVGYIGVVPNWAKRPNAGLVFLDYLMSPRGQTVWSNPGLTASPLPGIAKSLDVKALQIPDQSPYTPEVVKNYRDRWLKIFKPQ